MEKGQHVRHHRLRLLRIFLAIPRHLILLPKIPGLNVTATNEILTGYVSLMWGIFTAVMFLGTLKLSRAAQFVFGSLTVLFFLLAIGDFTKPARIQTFHWLRRRPLRRVRHLHRPRPGPQRTLRQDDLATWGDGPNAPPTLKTIFTRGYAG